MSHRADHPGALRPPSRSAQALGTLEVLSDICNGCALCFRIGCPAILKSDELDAKLQRPKALIDPAFVQAVRYVPRFAT